jgi:radical SAM superfamily enzyme YgiQ (UPF0313 family)
MTDKLDLLLIHPSAGREIYGALGSNLTAIEPPLFCRLIAGYVRDRGYSVKILDMEATEDDPHDVGSLVALWKPRLCAIVAYGHQPSASTQQMTGAGAVARAIKQVCRVPVILIGGHVSALPERTMVEETVDYTCVGEGPVTIEELLHLFKSNEENEYVLTRSDLADIPGLVWRGPKPGQVIINPSAPLIEDLSQLHGDVWDMLPVNRYRAHNWQTLGEPEKRKPYASIYTTLGCPYKCSFCCINAPFQTNRYRMRSPLAVCAEVEMLYRTHGVRTFKIVDEMFVLNERHYGEICERLTRLTFARDLNIWAYARVDTVKPHTLAKMRAAGIRWLALGIESGSKHVRDGAKKALKSDDIVETVRAIQAAGINVIGNFIFGLPDDTLETMNQTYDLAEELQCEFANFYCAMAYPGSPLYAEAVAKGLPLPETWSGYSQHSFDAVPLPTAALTSREILDFRDNAFAAYFTEPSYLAMVGRKFGERGRAEIEAMTRTVIRRRHREPVAAE